jgi:putative DNA methylase
MPVPALRALIFASLVDDPGDDKRPQMFELVEKLVASGVEQPSAEVISEARYAIQASVGEKPPPVLDPFCGGGSTLVEAQRLGLEGYGSDLNPIPVLISRVLTELLPKIVGERSLWSSQDLLHGEHDGLAGVLTDIDHYAHRVYEEARIAIGRHFPPSPNGDEAIAWWWARTVESPDPRYQGSHVPLVTNWWLSKKRGERAYVVPVIDRAERTIRYEVHADGEPEPRRKLECLLSGAPISFDYVRDQGSSGKLGLDLLAIVSHGVHGRHYFAGDIEHSRAARDSRPNAIPTLVLPEKAIGFRVQAYGMNEWTDLFLPRQQLTLETFGKIVSKVESWVRDDGGSSDRARLIAGFLGLCLGKLTQFSSTQCLWKIDSRNGSGKVESAKFGRNDLPMTSDFVEANPFGGSVGDWLVLVDPRGPAARVRVADARTSGSDLGSPALVVTDPPYFAAIGYANLSDYFYIWLRPALREVFPDLFGTVATPKEGELIAEPARHENSEQEAKKYFVHGFTETFLHLSKVSDPRFPMVIVYASKEQETSAEGQLSTGWEAMLEAVVASGLAIVGTWPIHGTGSTRLRGLGTNALATYVAMVCRERGLEAARTTRKAFLDELRRELPQAISVMQQTAIAPVDLAQAVMGPGMSIFTRYESVLEPDGSPMGVRSALILINSILSEVLDEQEGEFDSETRWAITWFEQFQFSEAPSGEADSLARAKVTSIDGLERAGLVVTRGGTCRLLRRDELPDDYDPAEDQRPTLWESVQHLVRELLDGGEEQAASLFARLANTEATRDLAYRLYAICERKGWAEEGGAYNILVASWPEIARLAQQVHTQQRLGSGQLPGLG